MLIVVSETPVDLIADHSLTAGTNYTVKAEIPGSVAQGLKSLTGPFVRVNDSGASAPTDINNGYPLAHLDEAIIKSGSDGTLWVWSTSGNAIIQVYEGV